MNASSAGDSAKAQREALNELCAESLQGRSLIIASNRGPVEFYQTGSGVAYRRGQGGLVTAMTSMVEVTQTTWVAAAMTETDAQVSAESGGHVEVEINGHQLAVSFVTPTAHQYHQYYDLVANSVLWFLQHNICNSPTHPTFDQALWDAWEHGYVEVNNQFADALATAYEERSAEENGGPPVFMIHDYHLYLVPGLLRQRFPDALIQHFTHIAWPSVDAWRQLPQAVRETIFTHLLGCDVIGFHCPRFAINFLTTCHELMGLTVNWQERLVIVGDREVRVRDYPISIDPSHLENMAASPEVAAIERTLMRGRPEQLILQVARTDPSKNILRSFHAYDHLLATYPEHIGKVQFLGLLPASRQTTELYKEYLDELQQVAKRINEEYGTSQWCPIDIFLENDYSRAIAAMKNYDVLVVNSIADGMNLVAKEGPIVNRRAGVLIISEAAGVVDELGDSALVVNPFDLVGTAAAFHDALTMPRAERELAIAAQRESICQNTIFRWATRQIADLLGEPETRPGLITIFPMEARSAEISRECIVEATE